MSESAPAVPPERFCAQCQAYEAAYTGWLAEVAALREALRQCAAGIVNELPHIRSLYVSRRLSSAAAAAHEAAGRALSGRTPEGTEAPQ